MVELAHPDSLALEPPVPAENFYSEVIRLMAESEIPFLLSGTYALACYTGISRPTKDVDVFATAGDCLKLLNFFKERGFDIQMVDERWLDRLIGYLHDAPSRVAGVGGRVRALGHDVFSRYYPGVRLPSDP